MGAQIKEETDRQRVQRILIDRLIEAGVKRPKAMKASELTAYFARLKDRLAYMSAENLETLAELVVDSAVRANGVMQAEVVVMAWAEGLEQCPPWKKRLVQSWFRSIEGPAAIEADIVVELYAFLDRCGVPPSKFDRRKIEEQAAERRREFEIWKERGPTDAQMERMQKYKRRHAEALAIIERGELGRAKAGSTGGDRVQQDQGARDAAG